MADNYLEKKMEEHRNGPQRPVSSYRYKSTPRGNRPGEWIMRFTPCAIHLTDMDFPMMAPLVKELAGAGFRVSFTGADIHRGTRLAATLAARFLPASLPPADDAIIITPLSDNPFAATVSRYGQRLEVSADMSDSWLKSVVWSAAMLANLNGNSENMLGNIKIEGDSL